MRKRIEDRIWLQLRKNWSKKINECLKIDSYGKICQNLYCYLGTKVRNDLIKLKGIHKKTYRDLYLSI